MPDGSVKPITVFYTVRWPHVRIPDADLLEIRFRRATSGQWEPTLWFEASNRAGDSESTNFTDLYQRFFAGR